MEEINMKKYIYILVAFWHTLAIAQLNAIRPDIIETVRYHKNYVLNPSARLNTSGTAVGGTAALTRDTSAGNKFDGQASFSCNGAATNDFCRWNLSTMDDADTDSGNYCVARAIVKGTAATSYSLQIHNGTSAVATQVIPVSSVWTEVQVRAACGTPRNIRIVQTTAGDPAALFVGRIFYGYEPKLKNTDFYSSAEAIATQGGIVNMPNDDKIYVNKFADTLKNVIDNEHQLTGKLASAHVELLPDPGFENAATNTWNFSAGTVTYDTGAGAFYGNRTLRWTPTGSGQTADSGQIAIKGLVGQNCSASMYYSTANTPNGNFTLSVVNASSTTLASQSLNGSSSFGTYNFAQVTFPCPTGSGTDTIKMIVTTNVASPGTILIDNAHLGSLGLYQFGSQAKPTIQKFTSGSGTYTTPANVAYIRVRMVGGGGGGGGGGNTSGNGSAGGNTTFGTLTANGGSGGAGNSNGVSNGGSTTIGSGFVGISFTGTNGTGSGVTLASTDTALGGFVGASTPFAGGGGTASGTGNSSDAAKANTGSGGGSGGTEVTGANNRPGISGAAGGYIDVISSGTVLSTYSYSVGSGGSGGSGSANGAGGAAGAAGIIYVEEYYSVTQNTAIQANAQILPNTQVFTASGTYTPTPGVSHIIVRAVGGGGGGGGGGLFSSVTSGNTGGTTSFGSLVSLTGGTGGCTGVSGGTATVNSPAIAIQALTGAPGVGFVSNNSGNQYTTGGTGGQSPFGGPGSGYSNTSGGNALDNSGSGGGGGGSTATATLTFGCAGAASGGYAEVYLANPLSVAASFSVTIGAGGTGGTAGTSGFAGGNGGSGRLIVTEYFGTQNAPLLVNSVITPYNGVTTINAFKNVTAAYTATISDETVMGDTSGGAYQITLPDASQMSGKKFIIDKAESSSNLLTLGTTGGQAIIGCNTSSTSLKLHRTGDAVIVQSNGSNWKMLSNCVRTEVMVIQNGGIASQMGSWVTYNTRTRAGDYTANIVTGIFPGTPFCTVSQIRDLNNTTNIGPAWINSVSSTSIRVSGSVSNLGSDDSSQWSVTCTGGRL